jgi:hypothetical protein
VDVLKNKSEAIRSAIALLRERIGSRLIDVVDWWPDDPDQIGIARPGGLEPVVCVLTADKAEGRFDLQYGDKLYRDCVVEGLCWVVRDAINRLA